MAGVTTFFAMSYILFVNPSILSDLVCLFSSLSGNHHCLCHWNAGHGSLCKRTVCASTRNGIECFLYLYSCLWVRLFLATSISYGLYCGVIHILITITKIRKLIIHAIPESMQHAIGGGIGIFVAYVGLKNANLLSFSADTAAVTGSTVDGDTIVSASI